MAKAYLYALKKALTSPAVPGAWTVISTEVRPREPLRVRGYRALKDADFELTKASCCYVCGRAPDAYMETGEIDEETRKTEWLYVMLLCFRCIKSWDLMEANSLSPKVVEEEEPPDPAPTPPFTIEWGP